MIQKGLFAKHKASSRIQLTLRVLSVALLLYFFLVSIGLMGAAFKGFGRGFAEQLIRTTSNPFVGLFIGILATSLVQSSSTTTSIVVGMVGSGVITVSNAIPIVMGANIGTTVTNTLVSLGHFTRREEFKRAVGGATVHDFFNLIVVAILFPLELVTRWVHSVVWASGDSAKGVLEWLATGMSQVFAHVGGVKFTSPIKLATEPTIHLIEHLFKDSLNIPLQHSYILVLIAAVMILFFSLFFLVRSMRSLVISKVEAALNEVLGRNAVIGIFGGLLFTLVVQSSSITTSLLVPLIAAGVLTIETAFPVVIGANVGTTGTAILASFATGNILGIKIAFVHFLFNVIGVLCIYPVKVFRAIPINLAYSLGDLAYRKRQYALIYVLGVFFVIPALLVFLYNCFR